MSKFTWGRVIDRFEYDFDGLKMEVTKYHPRKSDGITVTKEIDESLTYYHSEELRQSTDNLFALILAFIAYKNLGLNQHALVAGIAKALNC